MNIIYRNGAYTVRDAGRKGYEVYRDGTTAASRVASIGHGVAPSLGLQRAIIEADTRNHRDGDTAVTKQHTAVYGLGNFYSITF